MKARVREASAQVRLCDRVYLDEHGDLAAELLGAAREGADAGVELDVLNRRWCLAWRRRRAVRLGVRRRVVCLGGRRRVFRRRGGGRRCDGVLARARLGADRCGDRESVRRSVAWWRRRGGATVRARPGWRRRGVRRCGGVLVQARLGSSAWRGGDAAGVCLGVEVEVIEAVKLSQLDDGVAFDEARVAPEDYGDA